MALTMPSGAPDKKEVSSRSPRAGKPAQSAPTAAEKRSKMVRSKMKNALLLAGGLQVLGGGALAMEGCSGENGNHEQIGRTSQALSVNGFNVPTTPSLGILSNSSVVFVERSGTNITLYTLYDNAGDLQIYKVGTTDGVNWNSPSPTPVPGANSAYNEIDFKISGGKAYVVSERDGVSSKLYEGTWSGGTVGVLSPIPGTLNHDGAGVSGVALNSAGTKIFATTDRFSANRRTIGADVGTWTWAETSGCSDPTFDNYGMYVDTNKFVFVSNRTGTKGGLDIMALDWNGTSCSAPLLNMNDIPGTSAVVNNVNDQRGFYFDTVGDLWYTDDTTIKWATAKTPTGGDGGADGGGGDTGAGGDGGSGGDGGVANCKLINVAENPANIQLESCTDTEVKGKLLGPATYTIGSKTFTIKNVVPKTTGKFTFTWPKFSQFDPGVEKKVKENESDPAKKLVDTQYGGITGYEGTEVEDFIPLDLNPNKNKGQIDVIATTTIDGLQHKFVGAGCDPNQLDKCQSENFRVNGAGQGEVPKGVTVYKELTSGKISEDPTDFDVIPPVPGEEGCNCSTIQNHTSDNISNLLLLAGVGAIIARRRQKS